MAKAKETPAEVPASAAWFTKGEAGFERKHQQDKFSAMRKEKGAPRFYLKDKPGDHEEGFGPSNAARIVFLDSAGFWIHEHNLKLDGKWGNFFTCVKDFAPCEICNQLNDKSIYTCYFTVIDTRKFPKKDSSISKFRKVLLPAKGAAIDVIENLRKTHGDLRGLVVDVKRLSDRDPNCGRDYNVVIKDGAVYRIDPSKRFEGDASVPYDYMKILAPPSNEELAITGVSVVPLVGSADDLDDEETATDTPAAAVDAEIDALLGE
jgi:hypothetical protein